MGADVGGQAEPLMDTPGRWNGDPQSQCDVEAPRMAGSAGGSIHLWGDRLNRSEHRWRSVVAACSWTRRCFAGGPLTARYGALVTQCFERSELISPSPVRR
jgi:hypothetical protein